MVWSDERGLALEKSIAFHSADETWKCNRRRESGPTALGVPTGKQTHSCASMRMLRLMDPIVPRHDDFIRRTTVGVVGIFLRENVFVSIRVLNTSFKKRVFLRATFNGWMSYEDIPAYHSRSEGAFDQFDVKVTLPPTASSLVFAVCYEGDGTPPAWDSNDGENFTVRASRLI